MKIKSLKTNVVICNTESEAEKYSKVTDNDNDKMKIQPFSDFHSSKTKISDFCFQVMTLSAWDSSCNNVFC